MGMMIVRRDSACTAIKTSDNVVFKMGRPAKMWPIATRKRTVPSIVPVAMTDAASSVKVATVQKTVTAHRAIPAMPRTTGASNVTTTETVTAMRETPVLAAGSAWKTAGSAVEKWSFAK